MKYLVTTIVSVVLVECGKTQEDKNADLKYLSPEKLTPLDIAIKNNLIDIIVFLRANGAKTAEELNAVVK